MKPEPLIQLTLSKFDISPEELTRFSAYYNNDYDAYGNEVYDDLKVRVVHLDNFLKNNWWNSRFYFLWKYFDKYEQIIDLRV